MKKALLLFTDWEKGYWNTAKQATYLRISPKKLPAWDELKKTCPLPGLGIYSLLSIQSLREQNFVYLKINSMEYKEKILFINFEPIKESKIKSKDLEESIPAEYRQLTRLFCAMEKEEMLDILNKLDKPPKEWLGLF